ncbi:hypothetical protein THAOC_14606, partial [Thalassiosira oceanica]
VQHDGEESTSDAEDQAMWLKNVCYYEAPSCRLGVLQAKIEWSSAKRAQTLSAALSRCSLLRPPLGGRTPEGDFDLDTGMHQDLMCIPRKSTRRGLASRGKAPVQLAALPGFSLVVRAWGGRPDGEGGGWPAAQGKPRRAPCGPLVTNESLATNTTGIMTFRDPAGL